MKQKQTSQADIPPTTREELAARHGQVWDTAELAREFVVTAIIDGSLVVRRKSDGSVGTLMYQDSLRYYYRLIFQTGE